MLWNAIGIFIRLLWASIASFGATHLHDFVIAAVSLFHFRTLSLQILVVGANSFVATITATLGAVLLHVVSPNLAMALLSIQPTPRILWIVVTFCRGIRGRSSWLGSWLSSWRSRWITGWFTSRTILVVRMGFDYSSGMPGFTVMTHFLAVVEHPVAPAFAPVALFFSISAFSTRVC